MKNILLPILIIASLASCQKEINEVTTTTDKKEPIVLVYSSVIGIVKDENDNPVENVIVQAGTETDISDNKGNFKITNTIVKKNASIITSDVADYYEGIASARFSADGSSYTEMVLIHKGEPEVISSSNENSIATEGLELRFSANSFFDSDGNQVNEDLNVYAKYLDPTQINFKSIMPGELITRTESGQEEVLNVLAMTALDLESLDGDEITVSEESETTILMDVPIELRDGAPDELVLYLFDVNEQRWVPCGKCKLIGSSYHCTFYNGCSGGYYCCAEALPSICLSGQVNNADSTLSKYIKVIIEDLTDNYIYYGYTDKEGTFCGAVPQAAFLQMTIVDHCGNIVYQTDLGPYAEDFMLEDIWLDAVIEEYLINLTGNFKNCDESDLTNGHLAVSIPGKLAVYPFLGNEIDMTIGLNCISFPELEIKIYAQEEASSTDQILITEFGSIDLGELATCHSLDDHLTYTIGGESLFASPTEYYFKENQTTDWLVLKAYSSNTIYTIDLRDYTGVGMYDSNVFIDTKFVGLEPSSHVLFDGSSPDIVLEIIEDSGTYIRGTFSGIVKDAIDNEHQIAADFIIKKAP